MGSVPTFSDQICVLWGVFFRKKKKNPPRFYHRSNLLVWKNLGRKFYRKQILPNSKVVKFGFAPYLGGFVRVCMSFRLLCMGYDGTIGDTLRIDLSATSLLLLVARLGHSTLAPTTTKREITRISLPPSRVLCRPYSRARQSNSSPRGDDFELNDD